jgi:LPS O-antigen subunit length determinant protein (WzzB/FepE family)
MDKQDAQPDSIDLLRLVKVLVKRKWLVILGTSIFTLAAVSISFILPKAYESEGFFQLSSVMDIDLEELREIQENIREDLMNNQAVLNNTLQKNLLLNQTLQDTGFMLKHVSIPDYKKYLSQFTNHQKFLRFIKERAKAAGKPMGELKLNLRSSEDVASWVEPVYAYSKRDMSDLGQISRDIRNFVVGLIVRGEQETSQKAHFLVAGIGDFIKDSILYGKLNDYITGQLNKSKTEAKKYENFVIKDQFKLKQLKEKKNYMQGVLKTYPRTGSSPGREVVLLQTDAHRYLSPTAQLVGIEAHIADINENIAQNRRGQQIEELKCRYFMGVKEFLGKDLFGGILFNRCMELKTALPTQKEFPADIIRQVDNELSVDLDNFRGFSEEMQFLSGPTLPKKPIKPRKALIAAIAFVLGVFIFIFLAFFVEWWQSNKNKIET